MASRIGQSNISGLAKAWKQTATNQNGESRRNFANMVIGKVGENFDSKLVKQFANLNRPQILQWMRGGQNRTEAMRSLGKNLASHENNLKRYSPNEKPHYDRILSQINATQGTMDVLNNLEPGSTNKDAAKDRTQSEIMKYSAFLGGEKRANANKITKSA